MTKYTCDRCGFEATEPGVMVRLVVKPQRQPGRPRRGNLIKFTNDLCCDCSQALQKFIKNEPITGE